MSIPAEPREPTSPEPWALEGDELSLPGIGAVLLAARRTLFTCIVVGLAVGVLAAVLSPAEYKASGSFITQKSSGSSLAGLSGLAGQFGFSIPGADNGESPEFYQELLSSREVLRPVVMGSYSILEADSSASAHLPLLDLIDARGETEAARVDYGIEWVTRQALISSVGRQTGVVSFSITTRWPEVSYQIASALLRTMESFNLETRRTRAQAEREFLERRVDEAKMDLEGAENTLQEFLQQNRQFTNSPELQFRYERLQREVTTRQQVYAGLMEAFEQARIREVRDTPAITVLESPTVPPVSEPRRRVVKLLLGLIFGAMMGVGLTVVRHAVANNDDPDAEALRTEWRATREDFRRWLPWRGSK